MIDISRLFFIQFMDKDISRLELRSFVEDFLKKLAVQNAGGKYTAMLNATLAAYEAYFGALATLMTENVLDIAKANIGNPEAAKLFFSQSLLEDRNTPQEEPPVNPA